MNKDKDDIQKVMESLDNLLPASPRPYFYAKVHHRLMQRSVSVIRFRWYYALGIVFLLALNVFVLQLINKSDQAITTDNSMEWLSEEYHLSQPDIYQFIEEEYDNASIINNSQDTMVNPDE